MTSQHWFRLWLYAVTSVRQGITWAIVDPDQCCHMASPGSNEYNRTVNTLFALQAQPLSDDFGKWLRMVKFIMWEYHVLLKSNQPDYKVALDTPDWWKMYIYSIPVVPCQSDHPFLKHTYFKTWPSKYKVKVMGWVKGQVHIVFLTLYQFISLLLNANRIIHSWDMAWHLSMRPKHDVYVLSHEEKISAKMKYLEFLRLWSKVKFMHYSVSNTVSINISFIPCQLDHPFPRHGLTSIQRKPELDLLGHQEKNWAKIQIAHFLRKLNTQHTPWSWLVRCLRMKMILQVFWKIQNRHDSVHSIYI